MLIRSNAAVTKADIAWVVANMREVDRREIFACRFTSEDADLIDDIEGGRPLMPWLDALCSDAGEPVALLGVWLLGPRVGQALMLATDAWPSIALAAHRYVVSRFIPFVVVPNFQRLECRAWVGHAQSRAWLARLGFVEEGLCRAVGKAGEDFVQCALLPGEA